jgi:hypothetical protein
VQDFSSRRLVPAPASGSERPQPEARGLKHTKAAAARSSRRIVEDIGDINVRSACLVVVVVVKDCGDLRSEPDELQTTGPARALHPMPKQ